MEQGQLSELQRDLAWQGKDAAERQAMTAFNLGMDPEEAASAGIILNGDGAARKAAAEMTKAGEEKRKDDLARAELLAIAQRLSDMNAEIDGLMDELDENLMQQAANDQLIKLLKRGELDRNNPEVIELIVAAGLDPSLSDEELLDRAEDQQPALERAEEKIRTEIEVLREERDREAERLERVLEDPHASAEDRATAEKALADNPEIAHDISKLEAQAETYEAAVSANSDSYLISQTNFADETPETQAEMESVFGAPAGP
tara:strand:+ start:1669 stop:2448 length:780 start_codon:yes stop_codon:yes gene_type:complete